MKHHKKLKKGLALALSALCFASLCAGVALAAPRASDSQYIALKYDNNYTWDYLAKDGVKKDESDRAYILTDGTVTVQMTLGSTDLPSESGESHALNVNTTNPGGDATSGLTPSVIGTGRPGEYDITAKAKDETFTQEQLRVTANINSITSKNGYAGRVTAWRTAGEAENGSGSVGDSAQLETPLAISQDSYITIECDNGESPTSPTPTFTVKDAGGVFEDYKEGKAAIVGSKSDLGRPNMLNKKIWITLTKKDGSDTLEFWFYQPLSYSYIKASDGNGYVDADGVLQKKKDPDNPNKDVLMDESDEDLPRVPNNYIRYGSVYRLDFARPTSEILNLTVATPKFVAGQIAANIRSNNQGAFLEMAQGDRLEMITENITLTTYDWRYNAQFDIVWEWTPDIPDKEDIEPEDVPEEFMKEKDPVKAYIDAANAVIETPPPGQGTETHPTSMVEIKPLVEDISGTLTAKVYYKEKNYGNEPLDSHAFNVTVRGKGITASVTPVDQKYGLPEGDVSVPSEKYPNFPALATELPKQIDMDVFRGGIEEFTKPGTGACDYELQLNMGQKNARSLYAVVTLEEPEDENLAANANLEAVTLQTTSDKNVMEPYTPGAQIANPKAGNDYNGEGTKPLLIRAAQPGAVNLKIEYYNLVNNQPRLDSTYTTTIIVADTSPSTDSSLRSLVLRDAERKEPEVDFGFDPAKTDYQSPVIQLPYEFESYNFTPIVNETVASERPVEVRAWDSKGAPVALLVGEPSEGATVGDGGTASATTVRSGRSLQIRLKEDLADKSKNMVGSVYWISFTVYAADPRVKTEYVLCVTRKEPSEDDTLKSLGVYAQEDTDGTTNLITGFDPETKAYVVTVPYSTKYLRVRALQNFSRAQVAYDPVLTKLSSFGAAEYLDLETCHPAVGEKAPSVEEETGLPTRFEGVALPYLDVKVTSEKEKCLGDLGKPTGFYRVFINRLPASEEARMSALSIVDAADTAANPQSLTYTPDFNADNPGPYRATDANAVPYSTSAVRFKVTPMDPLVSAIRIYNKDRTKLLATIDNPNVYSEPVSLTARSADLLYNEFVVQLVAEAGDGKTGTELDAAGQKTYYTEYKVQIERAEANTDADLLSVALNDQDGAALKMFAFHRDETNYDITVPYAVRSVSFTAQLSDPNASIQLKDSGNLIHSTGLGYDALVSERPTPAYKLNDPGTPRTFELIVTAEDGKTTKTYAFKIDREPPSNDALLKKLTVDGLTEDGISPVFKPHDTDYSGTVAEGAEGIHITATTNDKNATVMIGTVRDGKLEGGVQVDSGQLSELVELLEVDNQLGILVTAEDGTTTMLYKLALYNQNLVDKTNNADLGLLRVERGVMTPDFKAAVQNYEVAVKEDTYSVDIIPKPDDPLAQIKVLSGTRELGDYNGNYALALADGENQVTVQVTSPDETRTKEYNLTIYRNQEDALKTLTPLTAEDLDFETEENPIIVSVTEYPRVESSVFTELKKHPEKTIIFQGLDYSLTFNAANLNTVIPTREIYDFDMSFTSPAAEEIRQHMGQWSANAELMGDLVMIYFDYHGDLPGPAMLNIKLGNKYGAQTLYWHYYNREEKRIDFYGTLRSNAQGTISVPVNHFSTYLVTRVRAITGAENYSNTLSQIRATIGTKQNPTTEVSAEQIEGRAPGDGT